MVSIGTVLTVGVIAAISAVGVAVYASRDKYCNKIQPGLIE